MFKNLRKAEGFTLIELIVVIAVLLLLMAIALPSFLGVRNKAHKAAAKNDLTIAYHNAKAEWADAEDGGSYPGSTALVAALEAAEPGLDFEVEDGVYVNGVIDVEVTGTQEIQLKTVGKDGVEYTGSAVESGTTPESFTVTP